MTHPSAPRLSPMRSLGRRMPTSRNFSTVEHDHYAQTRTSESTSYDHAMCHKSSAEHRFCTFSRVLRLGQQYHSWDLKLTIGIANTNSPASWTSQPCSSTPPIWASSHSSSQYWVSAAS